MFEEKMREMSVAELIEAIETINEDIINFADNEMDKRDYEDEFDSYLYDEHGDISIGDWSAPAYEVLKSTDDYSYFEQLEYWYDENLEELKNNNDDFQNLQTELDIANRVLEEKTQETPEEKIARLELENQTLIQENSNLQQDIDSLKIDNKNIYDKLKSVLQDLK